MDKIKSFGNTFKDAGLEFLNENKGWIMNRLAAKDENELIRLKPPDWMDDFITMAFKKLHFENHTGIIHSNINSVALAIGNKIDKVETMQGMAGNLVELFQAQKAGEWYARSSEYLLAVKLIDFAFPFVVFCEPVAASHNSTDKFEMVVAKRSLNDIVTYFQAEEKRSGRISVNVVGQKMYTIKPMEWESLVIDESINFLIKRDLETFLQKKEWFSGKGIPYRRGYLLHGPPGNGKTSVIRAMLTQARLPAFTIKKIYDSDAMYYFEDMFELASRAGGAFIILEDIDRSFTESQESRESNSNRIPFSVFLNCLDGIADSDGVIVVATANSPQILDKAILERPGRFDRVVQFSNPNIDLRKSYFSGCLPYLTDSEVTRVATGCANMNFAQLREIYIMASQIADEADRTVLEEDLHEAHKRIVSYTKAAGPKDVGYKK